VLPPFSASTTTHTWRRRWWRRRLTPRELRRDLQNVARVTGVDVKTIVLTPALTRAIRVLTVVALAAILGGCSGGSSPTPVEACADRPRASLEKPASAPSEPLLALLGLPDTAVILARLDPLSLEPVSRRVEVGEYHHAWSLSPDGSRLALGVSSGGSYLSPSRRIERRIGIMIVDVQAMKVVGEVATGIAAETVAWLTPRRLVASLQRDGTVLVDPETGKILRRWPAFSFPDASARTRGSLVMLFGAPLESAAASPVRLAVVDASGRLRSVTLDQIRVGGDGFDDRAGLAVDSERARAYVAAADAPVAEVDLRTMRVAYHLELSWPEVERKDMLRGRQRRALWIGEGQLAVFGRDVTVAGGVNLAATPAGVTLIDTGEWSACMLDERASQAALGANGLLIMYGPGPPVSRGEAGAGVRAYSVGRGEVFQLLEGEQVWDVQVVGDHAYVRTPRAVPVIDTRSGKVVTKRTPAHELVDVIAGMP
jgi:hypothetical protein